MTIQGQFKYNYLQFHIMGCNITGKNEDPDFNPHPPQKFQAMKQEIMFNHIHANMVVR
jgi:hypothetical protein